MVSQEIHTAPTGEDLLLFFPGYGWKRAQAIFYGDLIAKKQWCKNGYSRPTHWLPLPPDPLIPIRPGDSTEEHF